MGPSQLSLLQGLLDPGKAVLGAWNFSATGYTQGDPVYLSLQASEGQKFYDLDIWRFDGMGWAKYLNSDLAFDSKFASFVANGFSGYAISGLAAVPIPAAIWLFGSGLAVMVGLARRNALMKGDIHT
ncbi:MAG: VPLPA-CTERM sorting domain-containing protein [Nitrospira sp.]